MTMQKLAQQILALIEQAEGNGRKAVSETYELDFLLGALDDIKELCGQQLDTAPKDVENLPLIGWASIIGRDPVLAAWITELGREPQEISQLDQKLDSIADFSVTKLTLRFTDGEVAHKTVW